jgi:hypothetical protein
VTWYAYQSGTGQLLAVWPVGIGHAAEVVAHASHLPDTHARWLSHRLTLLSDALWDTYTRPASGVSDGDRRERWRREDERDSFELVLPALYIPNLPDGDGRVAVALSLVEEYAHALGRLLASIANAGLTEGVAREVGAEMRAVEHAERGDLRGRAAQAAALDRRDFSPAQVDAADRMLARDPLGPAELLTSVEPAAACVAATYWLAAAASVAGGVCGVAAADVFGRASDLRPPAVAVPALVVRAVVDQQLTPQGVVDRLLAQAVAAKEGRIPDLADLLHQVGAARQEARSYPSDLRKEMLAALLPKRTTPLDPTRPARDLLEHLLDGIRLCLAVVLTHAAEPPQSGATEPALRPDIEPVNGTAPGTGHPDPTVQRFLDQVRRAKLDQRQRLS